MQAARQSPPGARRRWSPRADRAAQGYLTATCSAYTETPQQAHDLLDVTLTRPSARASGLTCGFATRQLVRDPVRNVHAGLHYHTAAGSEPEQAAPLWS